LITGPNDSGDQIQLQTERFGTGRGEGTMHGPSGLHTDMGFDIGCTPPFDSGDGHNVSTPNLPRTAYFYAFYEDWRIATQCNLKAAA
jgi:hypothetical protein